MNKIRSEYQLVNMEHNSKTMLENFLAFNGNAYLILQLFSSNPEVERDELFCSLKELEKNGKKPDPEHYTAVYMEPLPGYRKPNLLERLYEKFNIGIPEDFRGHSMSVSDVVAVKENGKFTCYYCDNVGFVEIPGFFAGNKKDMISWDEWKDRPVPSRDKKYSGETRHTGLEKENRDWEYHSGFLEDFAYELQEAQIHEDGLMTWQEWYSLEYFFGQRLSYEDFRNLKIYYDEDKLVNGDILDLQVADPIIDAFKKGEKVLFTSSDSDSALKGEEVTILRLLTSEEADLFEVGPMYKVQIKNGDICDAFYDELSR